MKIGFEFISFALKIETHMCIIRCQFRHVPFGVVLNMLS